MRDVETRRPTQRGDRVGRAETADDSHRSDDSQKSDDSQSSDDSQKTAGPAPDGASEEARQAEARAAAEAKVEQTKPIGWRGLPKLVWCTLVSFANDGGGQMAAAISYYTIFSLPPLLGLLMFLVGSVVDPEAVRELLRGQVGALLGPQAAHQIAALIENVSRPEVGKPTAILGILVLAFGATGAFVQLQTALNTAWQVAPDPTRGSVKDWLLKRGISFAMIVTLGFLLLVSLVVSAALTAFSEVLERVVPGLSVELLRALDVTVMLSLFSVMFAGIYKFVPDAEVRWRDALAGGLVTALLFTAGKWAIGYYLGRSDPGSAYGAAGSLAVTLVWIYYSAVIILLGAEFTQALAEARGSPILPSPGAARVISTKERVGPRRSVEIEKQTPT